MERTPPCVMDPIMKLALYASFLVACSGGNAATPPVATGDLDVGGLGKTHVTPPPKPVDAPKQVTNNVTHHSKPSTSVGLSFRDDLQLLYRIAACGGDADQRIPESLGDAVKRDKLAKVAERHCKYVLGQI